MALTVKAPGEVQKLDRKDLRLLWYADFWDGPINGLCICDEKKSWFEMVAENEDDFPDVMQRRFLVFELSPEQLVEEEYWHELFRQKVGTHCDFEEPHPEVKPPELHPAYYEAHRSE